MRIGVSPPQTDIGTEPAILRDFAQAAEEIGYAHLAVYDHVVGVNPQAHADWSGPYTSRHAFHDPFALFGYLAGQTEHIVLTTHILILPQRQTALVARQAASVDKLSGGRLRLGIGIGWNPIEFTVLGEDFRERGQRSEEQIRVLQELWSKDHVSFKGRWHDLPDVGLNPQPVQKPIPIWLGGHHDNVLRRIAAMGDGWIILAYQPDETAKAEIAKLHDMTLARGRRPEDIGIDAWVSMGGLAPQAWRDEIAAWKALGVSHVTLNTSFDVMHHKPISGTSFQDHLKAIRSYYDAVSDVV